MPLWHHSAKGQFHLHLTSTAVDGSKRRNEDEEEEEEEEEGRKRRGK
jgi:hypothetical protein